LIVLEHSIQLRQLRRKAFLHGFAAARRPPVDRQAAVDVARNALARLEDKDVMALAIERFLNAGSEGLLRAASIFLASAVVVTNKMPETLMRALVAQRFFQSAREIMSSYCDNNEGNTLH
jgi:hypothetical protein